MEMQRNVKILHNNSSGKNPALNRKKVSNKVKYLIGIAGFSKISQMKAKFIQTS